MSSKKDTSQKKATQPEVASILPQTREPKIDKYSPPKPIPTFKDRPKPESPLSQPSKQKASTFSTSIEERLTAWHQVRKVSFIQS